jgi:hypothetical protein
MPLNNFRIVFAAIIFCFSFSSSVCSQSADSAKSPSHLPVIHAGLDFFTHYRNYFPKNQFNAQAANSSFGRNFRLIDLNLAWCSISYENERARFKATPALGYFMDKNYGSEPIGLRNMFEAYGGFCISESKNIWIDAGILPSPVSFENGFSHLQMLYSRGLAAEFSPYYFTGIRLSVPLNETLLMRLYGLNGWQVIRETNEGKSALINLEWTPSSAHVLNLNLYAGNEGNALNPSFRYLSEIYYIGIYKKWKLAAGVYSGWNQSKFQNDLKMYNWAQANLCLEYFFSTKFSLALRAESFYDPDFQMLGTGFKDLVSGSAMCFNVRVTNDCMFRTELRSYLYEDIWRVSGQEMAGGNGNSLMTGFSWNF